MIKSLSSIDVYNVINWLTNITSLATVFNQLPLDDYEPSTAYIVIQKVTDNLINNSFKWTLTKTARISFTIVAPTLDSQDSIENIKNVIVNEIWDVCDKIPDRNWITVYDIIEDVESPILHDWKQRQYLTKDFLFNYNSDG